jgi:hypothetical protein
VQRSIDKPYLEFLRVVAGGSHHLGDGFVIVPHFSDLKGRALRRLPVKCLELFSLGGGALRQANRRYLGLIVAIGSALAFSQSKAPSPEERTNAYFRSIRGEHGLMLAFLHEMPKGADLHSHLAGAVFAEDLIDFAARDKLCVDRATMTAVRGACDKDCNPDAGKPAAECAYRDQRFYNAIVDAWSMRNWERGRESAHDHFFAAFEKFAVLFHNHIGEGIARVVERAAADHLEYVELIHTPGGMQSADLGTKVGWNSDFAVMRSRLMAGGMKQSVEAARQELDQDESVVRRELACATNARSMPGDEHGAGGQDASASIGGRGCNVTVGYLYQVLRGLPPEQVFAQMLTGFELASEDPRVVGLNLVMAEDWYIPMRDFDLHMRMLDYLHRIYPQVHISLHAGELAMGLVPPERLSFHIRYSIERGDAQRISHGVSVMHEHNAVGLLREMAERNVLVEICLTSNAVILGVKGGRHPFSVYRKFHVPLALATDDEGVLRTDMTHEYLRAAETYNLSYGDLKRMARESLEHSFLPGESLWRDIDHAQIAARCGGEQANRATPSSSCGAFLKGSEKARMQWKLEQEFAAFEKKF